MIAVYGSSDDLIVIESDVREEFTYKDSDVYEPAGDLLAFSDGTVIRIQYTKAGMWRITPVVHGMAKLTIEQALEGDENNYSDKATLSELQIKWVVHGIAFAKARP